MLIERSMSRKLGVVERKRVGRASGRKEYFAMTRKQKEIVNVRENQTYLFGIYLKRVRDFFVLVKFSLFIQGRQHVARAISSTNRVSRRAFALRQNTQAKAVDRHVSCWSS